jgi:hypothetical protein
MTKQAIEKQQKDTDDQVPSIEEEELEKILEKMITMNFEKEDGHRFAEVLVEQEEEQQVQPVGFPHGSTG